MIEDGGFELLDEASCWSLLRRAEVGRVGISRGSFPVIFPVNYVVMDDAIVFRTAPGTKLDAAMSGAVVAFEVDEFDVRSRNGWSVLVIGVAEEVHDLAFTFRVIDTGLAPWAEGPRAHIVRIDARFVSGRRLVRRMVPG